MAASFALFEPTFFHPRHQTTLPVATSMEDALNEPRGASMKALACFAIGVVVGVVLMKNNQAFDELQKELDREKRRNTPPNAA
ncbi:hypothetical protein BK649_03570 [Pseudomonas canadensis]|uniref:Uncharacterized protein n=1 Tax=Pseudomonas canadensis TaxID=915099 RepID=A0A423FEQ7_9PSED|nr:hypothetical protein BK649_03570 [Pseudomonas canadensis]